MILNAKNTAISNSVGIIQGKHHIIKCILKYFIINIQTRPVTQ